MGGEQEKSMSPVDDFDTDLFAETLRSLYFERTREAAREKELILLAQVASIVRSSRIDREALESLTGAPGWIRLEKLLGVDHGTMEELLDVAANRIEALERPAEPDIVPQKIAANGY